MTALSEGALKVAASTMLHLTSPHHATKDNYTMASPYPSSMEANTMRQRERDSRGRPQDYDMYHTCDCSRSPCY